MNKVAKTNLYPEKASPAALAAAAFFDSLTPKQAEIFRQVLSPEQLTALAEVVTSVEKARQGEETAENKIKEVIKDRVIGMAKEKEKPRQIRARVEPGDSDSGDDTNPLDDLGLSRAQRFLLEQTVKMPPDKLEEVKKKLTPDQRKFLEETLPKVQEKMKGKDRK
jgi:hypothetical protein